MSTFPLPRKLKNIILSVFPRFGYRLVGLNDIKSDSHGFGRAIQVQSEIVALLNKQQSVIFDVGSNTGQAYQVYRSIFPDATIYCFEPFPQSWQELVMTASGDHKVTINQLALSSVEGFADFHVNANAQTNSLLPTDPSASTFWGSGLLETCSITKVKKITLDAFVEQAGLPAISILKLDVQGGEFEVLLGAQKLLQSHRIDLVFLEIILSMTYAGQHSLQDYLALLSSYGYHLVDFFDPYRNGFLLNQVDALFVSPAVYQKLAVPS